MQRTLPPPSLSMVGMGAATIGPALASSVARCSGVSTRATTSNDAGTNSAEIKKNKNKDDRE